MSQIRKFTDKQIRFLASKNRDVLVRAFTKHLRVAYVRSTDAAAQAVRQHGIHNHWAAAELTDLITASSLMASFLDGRENVYVRCNANQPPDPAALAGLGVHAFRSGEVRAMVGAGLSVRHPVPEDLQQDNHELWLEEQVLARNHAQWSSLVLEHGTFSGSTSMTVERGMYGSARPRSSIVETTSQLANTVRGSASRTAVPPTTIGCSSYSCTAAANGLVELRTRSDEISGLVHIETAVMAPASGLQGVQDSLSAAIRTKVAPVQASELDPGLLATVRFGGGIMAELLPGADASALQDLRDAVWEASDVQSLVSRLAASAGVTVSVAKRAGAVLETAQRAQDAASHPDAFDPLETGPVRLPRVLGAVRTACRDAVAALPVPAQADPESYTATGVLAASDYALGAGIPPQAQLMALCNSSHVDGREQRDGASATGSSRADSEAVTPEPKSFQQEHGIDEPDANWFDVERFSVVPVHLVCGCSKDGFVGRLGTLDLGYLQELKQELEQGQGAWPGGKSHLLRCSWCSKAYEADEATVSEAISAVQDRA
jgi:hypothetical protein